VSELFPPWVFRDSSTSARRSAGYHFLFSAPPKIKPQNEMREVFSIKTDGFDHGFAVRRDMGRLNGQRMVLIFAAIAGFLTLQKGRSLLVLVFGIMSLIACCASFGFLFLYLLPMW
jgi:hypothetical protein